MTPAQYLAVGRDLIILAAIGLLLWWVYRGGENAVKASDLKALRAQIQQQAATLSKWRGESNDAQATLSREVAAINAAPVVVHDWVSQPACPKPTVLPAATAETGSGHSAAGLSEPSLGADARADRRDAIVADFKQRWETVLAGCRSLEAQWPSP